MKPRTRRLLNRIADRLEVAAEALREHAKPPRRPWPLCFPTPLELMLSESCRRIIAAHRRDLERLFDPHRPPRAVRVFGDPDGVRFQPIPPEVFHPVNGAPDGD